MELAVQVRGDQRAAHRLDIRHAFQHRGASVEQTQSDELDREVVRVDLQGRGDLRFGAAQRDLLQLLAGGVAGEFRTAGVGQERLERLGGDGVQHHGPLALAATDESFVPQGGEGLPDRSP